MYMHVHVFTHILHTYSGMISKKYYAVPFDPLWSALLPAKTLKDPKFGAAGAVLSCISKYFKDMFQGCPPPLFLWHSAWFHVPRMLSRNPRRMKAVAIRNALLWNGGDARVSAGRKVQKSSHSEALRKTGMKCHLQEKNIILDKFWQPGWNFIVSCNGLCYEVVPDKEACESWSDRTKLLDIPSPIPCWVVPLHAPIPSYWTSVQKKCWTNKKYPSIRVPFSFSHLLDKILHSRQATPASLWTEGPQVCGA